MLANIIIGKPIIEPWYIFCKEEHEWKDEEKNIIYTDERYLPRIMKELGMAESISEIRRNRPELCIELAALDYLEVKYGKHRLWILVGN